MATRNKNVTMNDVAKLAGVSQSTVSLILNGKAGSAFPQETIDRVIAAAKTLNYRMKATTRYIKPALYENIMVLAVKTTNPYYSGMLHSIESEAVPKGYRVISCNTYHDPELEARYLQMAIDQKNTCVIFLYPPDNLEAFHEAANLLPVIAICDRASRLDTDIVELDNNKAGVLVAEHLISLGHRKIALITHPPEGNTGRRERIEGIQSVLGKHGVDLMIHMRESDPRESLEDVYFDYHVGYELAQDSKLYNNGITAFICINDMFAYGFIEALLEKKYRIPEDYSVISFDNLLYSGFSTIGLTTIDHHMELVGRYAIGVMLQKINAASRTNSDADKWARFKVECPPSLVIRNSTRRL